MSHNSTAAAVRAAKERHPKHYCPEPGCLWRTGDGSRCPHHALSRVAPNPQSTARRPGAQPATAGPAIIAFLGRTEAASPLGACACGLVIVGDAIIRQVGTVTHGALVCYRDEPDLEHEARTEEHEALLDYEDSRGVTRGIEP